MPKDSRESGQTLIAIIFLMSIALVIGVTITNRQLSTISQTTGADNSTKALAIAEAAIEKVLLIPNETLEDYIDFGNCGTACIAEVTDPTGQNISATVSLAYAGNSEEPFMLHAGEGESIQVNLKNYPSGQTFSICWDGGASIYASYIYESGTVFLSNSYAYNANGYSPASNHFSSSVASHGFNSCFDVTAVLTPRMVRVRPYYDDAYVYIIPSPGNLVPIQGIMLESTGVAGESSKVINVLKTDPIAPTFFDYVLFQKSTTETLSNGNN